MGGRIVLSDCLLWLLIRVNGFLNERAESFQLRQPHNAGISGAHMPRRVALAAAATS